jgi:hypothetical protein
VPGNEKPRLVSAPGHSNCYPKMRADYRHLGPKFLSASDTWNRQHSANRSTRTGTRTQDQLVKSQLLYQLSYPRMKDSGRRGGTIRGEETGMQADYWKKSGFAICKGKRLTEHLSHFCQRSGGSGIYATRLSMVWQAAGRVLSQLAGRRFSSSSGAGLCISFSKTHSK